MRVLIVASFAESLVNFRGPFIQSLLANGASVEVAAPFPENTSSIQDKLKSMRVQVHHVPLSRAGVNPAKDVSFFYHLWVLMRLQKYDAIVAYTVKPVVYGLIASWMVGVPKRYALITGLGYAFTGEARGIKLGLKKLLLMMYSTALKHASSVFFQNPDDQSVFRSLGLLKENTPSSVVNGSGIDTTLFNHFKLRKSSNILHCSWSTICFEAMG